MESDREPTALTPDGLTVYEVRVIAGAVAAATAPQAGLTRVQRAVLNAMCEFLLGVPIDVAAAEPVGATDFAQGMLRHDRRLIHRIVQAMLVGELLLSPIPLDVSGRVEAYAAALGVDDETIRTAREMAQGSLGMALIDFDRSGYFDQLGGPTSVGLPAVADTIWQRDWDNPGLASRWMALGSCPEGSLGLAVWRFYTARGFAFPGTQHSAPPLLAQHDWIHVLADYGSTVESEIEVFGLIARASPDFRCFSLLAMVISLFETGSIAEGAGGFFERDAGHISRDADRMGVRLGDAMSRGKRLANALEEQGRPSDSDLLTVDWFIHADDPLEQVREDFVIAEKSGRAVDAGSVGPWQPGGISIYQFEFGRRQARRDGRPYETWGGVPIEGEMKSDL